MDSAQLRTNDINNDAKRKSDVVNLIHEFLLRNNMAKTAQILKKQAIIADKQNIEEYIEAIRKSSSLHEQDKQHKIKTQLEKRYIKEISKGDYESALNILNQKMPEYFSEQDLQKFAESLIPSSEMTKTLQKNDCLLLSMFEAYFIKNPFEEAKLPNVRAKIFNSSNQIWYMKYSGQYIVAIDENRKAMTFSKNFDLLYEKDNMHDKMVSNLSWRNQFEFATCSESGEIKIWNYKLEQLHLFKYHKGMINCLSFFNFEDKSYLVSGGHDKYFVLNDITHLDNHKITKIKLKELIARDIKFYKKRNLLIFLNEKKKEVSTLKFYSPSSMKWVGQIKLSELFFEMEISQTDDVLHIISRSGEIINYSLKTHEKIGVFIGTNAKNFAIRIQKGGFMGQFLATGSESGEILFYNERKVQPIKRLKTIDKTVVNCVTWIDFSTIVCGCDNGKIQFWTYEKDSKQ